MRRIRTLRSTTDRIYDGGPIKLYYNTYQCVTIAYSSVSQTVVRGPQVVLGFCPCGPFRLNISPKKTEKIKLT